MDELSAIEAAKYLGVTREAVDLAAREGRLSVVAGGGPRRFSRDAVEEYHHLRQAEKVATLARSGETPVSAARKVRERLFRSGTGLPRSLSVKLEAMPDAWRAVFTDAELRAANLADGECRWCKAIEHSAVLGRRPVELAPARVELFGGQPCETCWPGLLGPYMAALAARVHGDAERPSGPAPRPSAAEREMAREWALQRPVTAAVKPVGDDDGRALVASALRTARARQKDAKRRGDQRYALQLAKTIRGLEADAALVDGRPSAVSKPGRRWCGHLVAAGCGCPVRGQR